MSIFTPLRHPSDADLFDFAEARTADQATLSARTASHVKDCESCREKLSAIQASLELVDEAAPLEPAGDLTASILLAAKNERRVVEAAQRRYAVIRRLGKGLSYAACLAVIAGAVYTLVLRAGSAEPSSAPEARQMNATVVSFEALAKVSPEAEMLSSAVRSTLQRPQNRWEWEQLRTLTTLDDDIAEALAALKNNPACVRATKLVTANRKRVKEALKYLYLERSL